MLAHAVPKATCAAAKSTHYNGSIPVRGHKLIKLGKKKHGRTDAGPSLRRRLAEPGQSRHGGCSSAAGLCHPKSCRSSSSLSVNPWQQTGCRHHADTRGVIKTRTLLWRALSKHVATRHLTRHWAEQRFSASTPRAGRASRQPLACHKLPSHYTKQKQCKKKDRIGKNASSPMMLPLPRQPRAYGSADGDRGSAQWKPRARGKRVLVTCCAQPQTGHWAPSGPGVLVQLVQRSQGTMEPGRGRRWRQVPTAPTWLCRVAGLAPGEEDANGEEDRESPCFAVNCVKPRNAEFAPKPVQVQAGTFMWCSGTWCGSPSLHLQSSPVLSQSAKTKQHLEATWATAALHPTA